MKLIDYFIIKYDNSSLLKEKSIANIISMIDKLYTFNDKFATNATNSLNSVNNKANAKIQKRKSAILLNTINDYANGTITTESHTNGSITTNRRASQPNLVPIIDEITEINYLSTNILINLINFNNLDTCAQLCAKINTILHSRVINTSEEASYLIGSIDMIINKCLKSGDFHENYYAFLIPIMKCIVDKSYSLLQMNFQIPNIPLTSVTPTFYEDFRDYCKSDEWRIFIDKQVKMDNSCFKLSILLSNIKFR